MVDRVLKIFYIFVFVVVFIVCESFTFAKEKYNPFDTNLVAKTPLSSIKGSYIPVGTKVKVALDDIVDSKTAAKGDLIHIYTCEDICVDGVCVVPAGYFGRGRIYKAEPAGKKRKTARIEIVGTELKENSSDGRMVMPLPPIPITNGIQMVEDTRYAYDPEWKYEQPTLVITKKGEKFYVQRGAFGQSLGKPVKSQASLGDVGAYYANIRKEGRGGALGAIFNWTAIKGMRGAEIYYPKGTEFYVLVSDNVDLGCNVKALEASRIAAEKEKIAEEKRRMEEAQLAEARRKAEQEERARIERSTEPVMPETTIK